MNTHTNKTTQLDPRHKAIVDEWLLNPKITPQNLILKHYPEAKPAGCNRRFKTILARSDVVAYRTESAKKLEKVVDIEKEEVVRFLVGNLRADIADLFIDENADQSEGGLWITEARLRELKERGFTTHIKSMQRKETQFGINYKIDLYDKHGAIDRIAKFMNWIEEKAPTTNIGVIVVPEGKTAEEQIRQYQQIPTKQH